MPPGAGTSLLYASAQGYPEKAGTDPLFRMAVVDDTSCIVITFTGVFKITSFPICRKSDRGLKYSIKGLQTGKSAVPCY
jgi:hypothetical protein